MSSFQKLSFLSIVVFVVGSSTANSALAYVTGGTPWPTDSGCVGLCAGQPRTIRYTLDQVLDGSILKPDGSPLPAPYIKASIEKALGFWTTAVNFRFVQVPEGPLTQLRFVHSYINGPDPAPPADPIPKAQATCIGYSTTACAVEYDHGDRWQESGTIPNPDILGATIHEVGHIIGLNHTNTLNQNMYWVFHRYSGLDSPELALANIPVQFYDDMAGIHTMYGAGTGSVTSIPEPTTGFLIVAAMICGLPIRRRR